MTATPNYNFELPDLNGDEGAWGAKLNANWTDLDTLLAGSGGLNNLQWTEDNATSRTMVLGESIRCHSTTGSMSWTLPADFKRTANNGWIRVYNGSINGHRILIQPASGDNVLIRGIAIEYSGVPISLWPGESVLIVPVVTDTTWSAILLSSQEARTGFNIKDGSGDDINSWTGLSIAGVWTDHFIDGVEVISGFNNLVSLKANGKITLYAGTPGVAPYGIRHEPSTGGSGFDYNRVLLFGFLYDSNYSGFTLGDPIYASTTVDGAITNVRQVGTDLGRMAVQIGHYIGNNTIFFNPAGYPHIDEAPLDGTKYVRKDGAWVTA